MFKSVFQLRRVFVFGILLLVAHFFSTAFAVMVPFTEDFEGGAANWEDVLNQPVTLESSGGSDGGQYVSVTRDLPAFTGDQGTIFRCTFGDNCSGGAFEGDWVANGVAQLSVDVMHDASQALSVFARIATPFNFPANILISPQVVLPGMWTTLTFDIFFGNPFIIYEAADPMTGPTFQDFLDVFTNVGNVQFGIDIPDGFDEDGITFGIDQVSLAPVPLPAAAWLFGSALIGLVGMRRRKNISEAI